MNISKILGWVFSISFGLVFIWVWLFSLVSSLGNSSGDSLVYNNLGGFIRFGFSGIVFWGRFPGLGPLSAGFDSI